MKMKLFSDTAYALEGKMYVPLLYPFFGETELEGSDLNVQPGRFRKYLEIAKNLFDLTELEAADTAIYPIPWQLSKSPEGLELANKFADKVRNAGKNLVVFVGGDLNEDVTLKDAFIFHTSLYRSSLKPRAFAIPALIDDLVENYLEGQVTIRQKQEQPVVGFCGHAPPLGMSFSTKKVKETVRLALSYLGIDQLLTVKPAHSWRVKTLLNLRNSKLIRTNFDFKNHSGMIWAYGYLLKQEHLSNTQQHRRDFIQNMVNSDYIVCVRGYGNYSVRLYETLCCGRIPVFVNTDCVLPYEFSVNWKDYCVWIEEDEIPFAAEKISDFHQNLSPQEFIELQHKCRHFWEQWLSPVGFFQNFYRHFSSNS